MDSKQFRFANHGGTIAGVARLCRERNSYTDLNLVCDDGSVAVHRMVFAAVSPFMRSLLSQPDLPPGDTTIFLPHFRLAVLQELVQFIYSGFMQLTEENSRNLQQLVLLLQIDPQNVGVQVVEPKTFILEEVKSPEPADGQKRPRHSSSPSKRSPEEARLGPDRLMSPGQFIKEEESLTVTSTTNNNTSPNVRRKSRSISTSPERLSVSASPKATHHRVRFFDGNGSPVVNKGGHHSSLKPAGGSRSFGGETSSRRSSASDTGKGHSPAAVGEGSSGKRLLQAHKSPTKGDHPEYNEEKVLEPVGAGLAVTSSTSTTNNGSPLSGGEYMAVLRQSENSNVIKIVNSRKRRLSSADSFSGSPSNHQRQTVREPTESAKKPEEPVMMSGRGRGGSSSRPLKSRGRTRGRGLHSSSRGSRRPTPGTGLHDLENIETWVCAICSQYDPVMNGKDSDPTTTEWIGCDCNRWFHKVCTKLKKVDDNFCCKMVHKVCLNTQFMQHAAPI